MDFCPPLILTNAASLRQPAIGSIAHVAVAPAVSAQAAECCAFNAAGWTRIEAFLSDHVRKTVAARRGAEVAGVDTVLRVLFQVMPHGETP
jgi:hypothetical protein